MFACIAARPRVFDAGGVRLHALESGVPGTPPVLLLHGSSAHAHWFDCVTPALAQEFHVLALDQRGHGRSSWPEPPIYDSAHFTADIGAVLETMEWTRPAILGHSMGGHNALCFAAWHPDRVGALVLVDCRPATPAARREQWKEQGRRGLRVHATIDAAIAAFRLFPEGSCASPMLLAHIARAGLVEADGGWRYAFDPLANATRAPVDAWPLLPLVLAPTLIVRGERSTLEPRETAVRMASRLRCASFVEIPHAYHHVPLDAPAPLAELAATFLKDVCTR